MTDTREELHDTSWIEHALQGGQMNGLTREAQDRDFCIECNYAVGSEDHKWKYIGVGGFLTGPFCSKGCHWEFLSEDND